MSRNRQTKTPHSNGRVERGHMSYHAGLAAEDIVARRYTAGGWMLQERRWRGHSGEIDLILRSGNAILLVEVKQSKSFDSALAHLTPAQSQRLYQTGAEYLGTLTEGSLMDVRIDVALVDRRGHVSILENAIGHDL